MPTEKMTAMREHLGQVTDMNAAIAPMHWDREVFMPPKAAPIQAFAVRHLVAAVYVHSITQVQQKPDFLRERRGTGNALTAVRKNRGR